MRLFKIQKNAFTEIYQSPFKLEQEIQSLIESNVTSIFEYLFIKSEFTVGKYRVDTLCFNEEENSFVLIEYKKGKNYSVIDQGYTYLQLLLNNKSTFTLLLSQYYNKVLKEKDIDWSQSKIIFISPSFNSYQRDSVNFKDLPFELWEIKKFEDGTVTLDQHHASSNISVNTIANPTKTKTDNLPVKESELSCAFDELLEKSSTEIKNLWNIVSEALLQLDDVVLKLNKKHVTLKFERFAICYIDLLKNEIKLQIERGSESPNGIKTKNFFSIDDPKQIVSEQEWSWRSGTKGYRYTLRIDTTSDIDYIMFLIKQKYQNVLNR